MAWRSLRSSAASGSSSSSARGPVDQRAGQRYSLLLAAGQLARAPVGLAVELHQLEHLVDPRADLLPCATDLRRSPNATLSKTYMCGNSA